MIPCLLLGYRNVENQESKARIEMARRLLAKNKVTHIFITTAYKYKGENIGISMCKALARYPEARGHIRYLGYGLNTAGEVAGFAKALGKIARKNIYLSEHRFAVSSSYHCQRVDYLFAINNLPVRIVGTQGRMLYTAYKDAKEAIKLQKEKFFYNFLGRKGWIRKLNQPLTSNMQKF